jgi:lipopolysaccharide transport system ATP-binding protein
MKARILTVRNVCKTFRLYRKPSDLLKEVLLRRCLHQRHNALDAVTFNLHAGETLGVLGKNGAGKSTLLKVLTGVMIPDSGHIERRGRITGLLELGTGFDRALTGLQNITGNGLLLGMSHAEIAERCDRIVRFSELGRYIDEPVRTYSSGMIMRLAFAIAIHADPDCFVVDEALSVGDGHFQQKCMKRIREFSAQGGGIVFVSHDLNAVRMLCDRTFVLDRGRVVHEGSAEDGVNFYNRLMAEMQADDYELSAEGRCNRAYGSGEVLIEAANLVGERSHSSTVAAGEWCELSVRLREVRKVPRVTLGFLVRDRFGQDVFGTNTEHLQEPLAPLRRGSTLVRFRFCANIAPGKYTITLAVHSDEHHLHNCYHWCDNWINFEVAGSLLPAFTGLAFLPTAFYGTEGCES